MPPRAASCPQVTAAEGFGKRRLFEIMDDLEAKTRGLNEDARKKLAAEKGASALEAHNISHALAGGWRAGVPAPRRTVPAWLVGLGTTAADVTHCAPRVTQVTPPS